jgi:hypothetical protein
MQFIYGQTVHKSGQAKQEFILEVHSNVEKVQHTS